MSIVIVNSGAIQPVQGQNVLVGTLAGGPFDAMSVYVTGGGGVNLSFKMFALVGSLHTLVAQAAYLGPSESVLQWQGVTPEEPALTPVLEAAGTSFELFVFAQQSGIPS